MQYGEVVSAVILIEKGGTGLSRGCAFVCYATEAQAQAAITGLDNQITLPGGDYNMRVGYTCFAVLRMLLDGVVWCVPHPACNGPLLPIWRR